METRNMKQHVSFVGAIHIGFGILGLLGALTVFIVFNFAGGFVSTAEQAVEEAGEDCNRILTRWREKGLV